MDAKEILSLAYLAALKSPDPNTQVGAVLITPTGALIRGYNTPFGKYDKVRYLKDRKYRLSVTIHAELCTLLNAASVGERTEGATMYAPWSACSSCASAMIAAGVRKLIRHEDLMAYSNGVNEKWQESIANADKLLHSKGITILEIEGTIDAEPILIQGHSFDPGY